MKYIRMFLAGMAFPSLLLPFLFLAAWAFGNAHILCIPFLHFIPLIWGAWNILYFTYFLKKFPRNQIIRLLITGGILGFLIALYGVFILDLPLLLGFPREYTYLPLVVGPILYALFWLLIVHPLNRVLGINEGGERI